MRTILSLTRYDILTLWSTKIIRTLKIYKQRERTSCFGLKFNSRNCDVIKNFEMWDHHIVT
jgi:hypothetical protein